MEDGKVVEDLQGNLAVETRDDLWWINDEYITMGLYMVAQQFICEQDSTYDTAEDFAERATYILRQHCPILYSFFFTQAGAEKLPYGSQMIVLNTVRESRPLFMAGLMV